MTTTIQARESADPSMQTGYREWLLARISSRQSKIAVAGLGYVGLPLAIGLAEAGFQVFGIDSDQQKASAISRGESYISDVPGSAVEHAAGTGLLRAGTSYAVVGGCDVVLVCVPTPLSKTSDPDLSFIKSASESVGKWAHPGMLVVLESTTYPGTTREVVVPRITSQRLSMGKEIFCAFSPERIDPGQSRYTLRNTPKVVGGLDPASLELASALYRCIADQVVPVSSAEVAEMSKILENTFRSVNIALANELLIMCDHLSLDAWEVIEAAATKPYGFMKFTPGPGVGGHCIPLDPEYLSWRLKKFRYHARFIHLAGEINRSMPAYWVQQVSKTLNLDKKPVNGSRILVLGVAYKPNVGDIRESPAIDIVQQLQALGANVSFHDFYVQSLEEESVHADWVELDEDRLRSADCVVIATDHASYDWDFISSRSNRIVDTRHAIRLASSTQGSHFRD